MAVACLVFHRYCDQTGWFQVHHLLAWCLSKINILGSEIISNAQIFWKQQNVQAK